jgi:hypothetical protein
LKPRRSKKAQEWTSEWDKPTVLPFSTLEVIAEETLPSERTNKKTKKKAVIAAKKPTAKKKRKLRRAK